jgi:hypothetical protein
VLVHVEREDRRSPRQRMTVVGSPLVDELAVSWRPGQQHPTGAAAERLAHGDEFGTPAFIGTKVARQRFTQRRPRLALFAETVEEQLVEDHRVHRDQLLALKTVHEEAGRGGVVQSGELLIDHVEALYRAAIVVLVMADDQPLRHAVDARRITGKRLHTVAHLGASVLSSGA